jgi:hypothetical protein
LFWADPILRTHNVREARRVADFFFTKHHRDRPFHKAVNLDREIIWRVSSAALRQAAPTVL